MRFAQHALLSVEGLIDKMRHIYPLNARHVFITLMLLAFSLLFLLAGRSLYAQGIGGIINYQENGTGPVATFTGTDPEGQTVYWSKATTDLINDEEGLAVTDNEDAGAFSVSSDGVLTFSSSPDYETPTDASSPEDNIYSVVVVASDDAPGAGVANTAYRKVVVRVTNVDDPGRVTLNRQQPQANAALTATLADDDRDAAQDITWMWERASSMDGPWTAIVDATTDNGTTSIYTPVAGVVGKYLRVTATYTDSYGSGKTETAVSAHAAKGAIAGNTGPPAAATATRSVAENSPADTAVGKPVTATDPNGDVLTYGFDPDDTDAASFNIGSGTGQITVKAGASLNYEDSENRSPEVTVTATDPSGFSGNITVTINITNVNESPRITGGLTRKPQMEGTDRVVGAYTATDPESAATDDACTATTCSWSLIGDDAGDFSISNDAGDDFGQLAFKADPNYESPADANGDNIYMVSVMVTDGANTAMRDVAITVTNEEEPGSISFSSVQPKVGVPFIASASDPDGGMESVTWKWYRDSAGNNAALRDNGDLATGISPIAGATSGTYTPGASDLDSDTTAPGNQGYYLWAEASYTDGTVDDAVETKMASKQSANAVILDTRNGAPEFKVKPRVLSVVENTKPNNVDDTIQGNIALVTATDRNNDVLTYSLGGADAASFSIDSSTGQLSVKAKLDREAKSSYMVTVTATDPYSLSDSVDVTIMVTDEDEVPMIAGDDIRKDYQENGTNPVATFTGTDPEGQTIYWSKATTDLINDEEGLAVTDNEDAGAFSVSSDGVLTFSSSPDYETPTDASSPEDNIYSVVVVASDDAPGAGVANTAYRKVVVRVTNVDDPGRVTLNRQQPQANAALTATLADDDRDAAQDITWMWSHSTSSTARGDEIDDATTDTGTTSIYTPVAGVVGKYLRVTATYTDSYGSGKTETAVSAHAAKGAIAGNTGPAATTATRSVAENSPADTAVGKPVTATDPNGDVLTYGFDPDDTDAASFNIGSGTGQITVKAGASLNYEDSENRSPEVTVTATDPSGLSGNITVTINITNVNESPRITGGLTRKPQMEGTDRVVGAYTATDPESAATDDACTATTCSWSLIGDDAGDFSISNDAGDDFGQLAFKADPNYESPADANGDNIYMVSVMVTDGANTAMRDVAITVTNEEEPGSISFSSVQPNVGVPFIASASDPDGGMESVTWKWYRDSAENNEALRVSNTDDLAPGITIIVGATSDTYTPGASDLDDTNTPGDRGYYLWAEASYTDGTVDDAVETKMASKQSANAVILDTRNGAPEFKVKPRVLSVVENTKPNNVDDTIQGNIALVTATDRNNDVLTYSLGGADAASFSIDSSTGQLSVKAKLDREDKSSYMVTVTATDPDRASDSVDVTIMVTDEDEAPMIMVGGLAIIGPSSIPYAENGTDEVATYTLAGPNRASARLSLEGADADDFRLSGGVLSFKSSPDYETPTDADNDNTYMVTLKADDGMYMDTHVVLIRVTDEDETTPGDSLLERYDDDRSGRIDRNEVIAAIDDYLFGVGDEKLTRPQVIEVIDLYLFGG